MPDRDETPTELPDDLVDVLKRADRAPAVVTRAVDLALGDASQAHFASRGERRAWLHRGRWVALAASMALATVLAVRWGDLGGADAGLYADVDDSGRIDIADVLVLARAGTASRGELDAFAMRVVALDGGAP